jgi:hypothetical protein
MATVRRRLGAAIAGLGGLLALLLWLSPAEQTLGQTVKLVYLHGALVQTAILLFAVSLCANLVGFLTARAGWQAWGKALTRSAVTIWLAHTAVSMVTTYAAWGLFVAWYEPRTRFTFILAGVSLLVITVAYFVADDRFSALAFAVLAGLTLALLPRLAFVQHPLDPLGTSSSNSIRAFYGAILLVTLVMGGVLTVWLRQCSIKSAQT